MPIEHSIREHGQRSRKEHGGDDECQLSPESTPIDSVDPLRLARGGGHERRHQCERHGEDAVSELDIARHEPNSGERFNAVTKFVANALVLRSRNPADDGDDFRVARTARVYDPANTWVQFLWFSLRDALMVGLEERPDPDRDGDGEGDREQERGRKPAKP